jgi:stage II sporulation protein D
MSNTPRARRARLSHSPSALRQPVSRGAKVFSWLWTRYAHSALLALQAASVVLAVILLPVGCSHNMPSTPSALGEHVVRVRLLQDIDQISFICSEMPVCRNSVDQQQHLLRLPLNTPVQVHRVDGEWRMGSASLGKGQLTLMPSPEGSVAVSHPGLGDRSLAYRGYYRLVPTSGSHFDLINDVGVEGYLSGVLPKELPAAWHQQAYDAQCIVARTYVLYTMEKESAGRYWDVYPDQRSQMYGGISAESVKSRAAVNETMGIVVGYAQDGVHLHLIKAYFSSCCGGVTQSAHDAFGEPYSVPLSATSNGGLCNASPRFNWGPIVISKKELTRRIALFGARRKLTIARMAPLADLRVSKTNDLKRPSQFEVKDAAGRVYRLKPEDLRVAVNTDAINDPDKAEQKQTLPSAFMQIIVDVDKVRFVEGHGFGHGVGFCQFAAQARAEMGMSHEDIVLAAYPHTQLYRKY